VFSRSPPTESLAAALATEGLHVEWTDSGPGAVGEAVAGEFAVCVVAVDRRSDEALDYLPCLNQADPLLPVVVVNDVDSLEMQRKIRSHKVFYYLLSPLDPGELREVLRTAVRRGAAASGS
jgi:DNA-binding NtrC family response regulator